MMLTREQAAATWCPMVRTARNQIATHDDCADQRRVPETCRCIADGCAMWRWGETKPVLRRIVTNAPELGPGAKRMANVTDQVPHRGYCGLAGAPVVKAEAA